MYRKYIKRTLDVLFSGLALIVLSPVLLITALLVRVKLGSPVLFRQARPGKNEKIFQLYKFRSMTNETDADGRLLPDSKRLTCFGKFLRASSLDELPELINIIKGDMSIVGPRPLSIFYLPHYPSDHRKRHLVRPGLTGLAQINGRNNLQWDERFALDLQYVEKLSFMMDVRIVFGTIRKVLMHSDVSVRGDNRVKDYGPYCVLKEEAQEGGRMTGSTTYSEIGSYFWLDEKETAGEGNGFARLPQTTDSSFTFSGRNAIDLALRDVLKNRRIHTVFAPSYCCVSMLQAFVDRGMKIEFYPVSIESGEFQYSLPETDEHSLVLIMSYFGLDTKRAHEKIRALHQKGTIVMEDITHSLLRKDAACDESDYVVASLRKWFEIPTGGWVGKRNGVLAEKPLLDSNHAVAEKITAMQEKYAYLIGAENTKEHYLEASAVFENDLIHVDRLLKIDDTSYQILGSIDVEKITDQRRRNAGILSENLKDMDEILSFPKIDLSEDVPLFLPIFLETEQRDSLRKHLIANGIFCPVHWPEVMGAPKGIRENELSLICDQRYSEREMLVIADAVRRWYGMQAQ